MGLAWDKQPSSRAGVSYVFTSSGTSQATSTFGTQTRQIRVSSTSGTIWIKYGAATVTADSTSGHVLGTSVVDYFLVNPGEQAAIVGTGGSCSITEMG